MKEKEIVCVRKRDGQRLKREKEGVSARVSLCTCVCERERETYCMFLGRESV